MRKEPGKSPLLGSVRNRIQLAVFMATLAIGFQFLAYVHQASGNGRITIVRPPGVEGFLPIGALMSWKRFFLSGQWDPVHPAAMVILAFAIFISFFLRKSFCGWFCPVGAFSEGCWRLGRYLFGKNVQMPKTPDLMLRSVKYILLGFFIFAISAMSTGQILEFIESPYYKLSDVKMLFFFTRMSVLTAGVLIGLTVLSLLFKNFWCRYLCPYGAFLGLFSWFSPTGVKRDRALCTRCGKCDTACPSFLSVSQKEFISSPECTGCMACVDSCPAAGALSVRTKGIGKTWRAGILGCTIIAIFIGSVYFANLTGHWQGVVGDDEFRQRLVTVDSPENTHPSFELTRP